MSYSLSQMEHTRKLPCTEHHINLYHSAFSFLLLCSFIQEQNALEVQRPPFYPKLFDQYEMYNTLLVTRLRVNLLVRFLF